MVAFWLAANAGTAINSSTDAKAHNHFLLIPPPLGLCKDD
jgi:hypothetical protein